MANEKHGYWVYDLTDIIGSRKEQRRVVPVTRKVEIQARQFRVGLISAPSAVVFYMLFQSFLGQWALLPAIGCWLALTAVLTSNATRGLKVSRAQRLRNSVKFKSGRIIHCGEDANPCASPMVRLWYMDAPLTGGDAARGGGRDGLDEMLGASRHMLAEPPTAPGLPAGPGLPAPAPRGPIDLAGVDRRDPLHS